MVTFPIENNNHATECDICMYSMKAGAQCTLSCCKQTLHKKCLLKWAVIKRSEYLTCPFCRSVILDIFSYISLSHVSQWLVYWNYNHSIVVKGKNVQIFIEEGFRPLPTDESSAREPVQESAPSTAFYNDTDNNINEDESNDELSRNDTERHDVENNTLDSTRQATMIPTPQQIQQVEVQPGCDTGFWMILSIVLVIIVISVIIILCTGLL